MVLTAGTVSLCASSFALQSHYAGLYNSSYQSYMNARVQSDIDKYRSESGKNEDIANAFFGTGIAMIPVSIVMLIPGIVLYAIQPSDIKYQKEIDDIRKKINNFNVTANFSNDKMELGIGIKF